MKLSIVVPRYKESEELLEQLYDSIAMQRSVDFKEIEVIEVHDGGVEKETPNVRNKYPFTRSIYYKEHSGVSATRNYGLDKATGDYVMFCDADDMFLTVFGLRIVFQAMKQGFDIISSAFMEEQPNVEDDLGWDLYRHDKDVTFVHGKVYRRGFLLDENIRFNDELTIHEDGYFNALAFMSTTNRYEITSPFYLWKWNDDSVVRKDSKNFTLKTYGHLMKARIKLCEELEKREMVNELIDTVVKTICDSYYDFNKNECLVEDNKKYVQLAKEAFRNFYLKYRSYYNESSIEKVSNQMAISRQMAMNSGFRIEQCTIHQFITEVRGNENV